MPLQTRITTLERRNLDRDAAHLRMVEDAPRNGWIAAARSALGMSAAELAQRLGVSQQAVAKLEASEAQGGITLRKLQDAARAINCRLAYGFVPVDGEFDYMVRARAREVAETIVAITETTMSLEAQAVDPAEREARIQELADQLYQQPRQLWKRNGL